MLAREMLIEFERRLAQMNPELANSEKVDSDTIFSFLNAYTLRFVLSNLMSADKVENDTRAQKYDTGLLSPLLTRVALTKYSGSVVLQDKDVIVYEMPEDYVAFIRCTSNVIQLYKGTTPSNVPVKLIKQDDADKVLNTIHNSIILPYPCAVLYANSTYDQSYNTVPTDAQLMLYKDVYTNVYNTVLTYCRKPKEFNVIGVNNTDVLDHCELPEAVHMAIVEGAVEMFITEAKYRLNVNPKKQEDK